MLYCGEFIKDPDARLDYGFDFTAWLDAHGDNDFLALTTVTATSGVLVEEYEILLPDAKIVAYWLSGGTADKDYIVTCHIETDAGREDNRSHLIKCRER